MESRKCMIAGLPSSGKSTYIGALWYNLCNSNTNMLMSAGELPVHIELLEKLSDLWQKIQKIERNSTEQNVVDNVLINLKVKQTGQEIALSVPDFWGEKFYNIIDQNNTDEIDEWCKEADSLFYMVCDVSNGLFYDDDKIEKESEGENDVLPLETKTMSPSAINIMVLKYLFSHKKFKRLVLAVTRWDDVTNNGDDPENPEVWLKSKSPALYNFVKHNYPDALIIGLSAQGCNYRKKNWNKDDMLEKTENGVRAFVNDKNGIYYDLSKPLNFLMQ